MTSIRIIFCDDHPVVRDGLRALIGQQADFSLIGEAQDGVEAVALVEREQPDVALLDMSMPKLNGIEAAKRICAANVPTKVLALTVHEDRTYVRQFLHAGARGYILKHAAGAELVQAIRTVAANGMYVDPHFAAEAETGEGEAAAALRNPALPLSERETEVIRQLARGLTNKETAALFDISVKSVETYKARALDKLNLRSRTELVRFALQAGWLDDES